MVIELSITYVCRIAGAAMVTVGGLYLASNQNLRHGSSHDTQAKAHKAQRQLDGENDAPSEKESTAGGHAASIVGAGKGSVDRPKHEPEPESQNGKSNEAMGHTKIQKKDDPSQPGAGRPDPGEEAGLVGHGPKESPKSMESGAAPPDVSDKVRTGVSCSHFSNAKQHSPILAESPRAKTRLLESKRAYLMPTLIIPPKYPVSQKRARRVKVLLKVPSSKAPSLPTDLVLRTRKNEAKLRWRKGSIESPPITLLIVNFNVCHLA